jgi:hypothetical protein
MEMCDYCGCRSMPVIDVLGNDHIRLQDLAGRVRRAIAAGSTGQARELLAELVALLRLHTDVEEASVFAGLRAAGELGDDVDALLAQHQAAWTAVARLEGESWKEEVLAFLDDLDEHIAREEYDLFPASLVFLPPLAWDEVEAAARRIREQG